MYTSGKILRTDADLENAILFALHVEVLRSGILIDYGGLIKKYDDKRVHIQRGYFPRCVCEFRVR